MIKQKSPTLAAVLSLFFGPFGYFYIGWRYALMALVTVFVLALVFTLLGFDMPPWIQYVNLPIFAWKAYTISSTRNELIKTGNNDYVEELDSFVIATMAMTDLMVGIAMYDAGAIALYASVTYILHGSILRGLFILLIGTPLMVWLAGVIFTFAAMGIDSLVAVGTSNPFLQKDKAIT